MEQARKKKIISLSTLIIGLIVLIIGLVFLILKITSGSSLADGDFLVENSSWTLENSDSVIWNFTEIGKGTLTTNNHQNDYSFIWALEDDQLKIETSWLYNLDDTYTYKIDQSAGTLTLTSGDQIFIFKTVE